MAPYKTVYSLHPGIIPIVTIHEETIFDTGEVNSADIPANNIYIKPLKK